MPPPRGQNSAPTRSEVTLQQGCFSRRGAGLSHATYARASSVTTRGFRAATTLGKKWGPELVEEARRQYRNASQFLETTSTTKVDVKAELLQSLLKAVEAATGKKADGGVLTGESLKQVLRDALGAGTGQERGARQLKRPRMFRPLATRAGEQRVVDADMTGPYLAAGWAFRSPLSGYDGGCRVAGNNPEWEVSPRSGGAERR